MSKQEKREQQRQEEQLELDLLTRVVGKIGYSIIESRTDNRKFDYRIKKNRP